MILKRQSFVFYSTQNRSSCLVVVKMKNKEEANKTKRKTHAKKDEEE